MPRVALRENVVITLDSNGAGTAKIGPLSAREVWYPINVHIKCSTSVRESACSVYAGNDASQSSFRDDSVLASSGASTGACGADVIKSGSYIWAVWTGGDAGAQATLSVTGVRDV